MSANSADPVAREGQKDPVGEQRVTPLELFFDLVFVFSLAQVQVFLPDEPTWAGLLRGAAILAVLKVRLYDHSVRSGGLEGHGHLDYRLLA